MRLITPHLHRLVRPKDSPNVEFWMSHLLIILSTVLGVYLAAAKGFEIGIDLSNIDDRIGSYQVQSKLLDEVEYNVNHLEKWINDIRSGGHGKYAEDPDRYSLSTIVWSSLRHQPAAMDIPRGALSNLRTFYRDAPALWSDLRSRRPSEDVKTELSSLLDKTRDDVLPPLRDTVRSLANDLESAGVELK